MHDKIGRFKGFAYVEFDQASGLQAVMEKIKQSKQNENGDDTFKYDDQVLKISPALALAISEKPAEHGILIIFINCYLRPKQRETEQLTLFVLNLAYSVTDARLKAFFQGHLQLSDSDEKGVKEVRLVKDKNTGRSRGFAYVEFHDTESMNKVICQSIFISQ